ncbi:hypothetical protein D6789_03880, partial [Candidatus Woesearchaeota archaeon]
MLLLLTLQTVSATTVMGNSKEWQDLYLSAMYAHTNGYDFVFIESLGDADIQSQLLEKDEPIIIIESSKKPVIKNYESFLSVGGFTNLTVITAEDYRDLQLKLFGDADSYFILDPTFGMEAVAAAPLILKRSAAPLFLDAQSKEDVKARASDDSFVIGHFPLRIVAGIPGERLAGYPTDNALDLALLATRETKSSWGVIARADRFDPASLAGKKPIFLIVDDTSAVAEKVKESGITRFEVIGADMADIAKSIEAESGKDLHLLLKYGQTITNLPGLEGKILTVRQVSVPYPTVGLELKEAVFYPETSSLVVTFRNPGTLETKFFSNLELGELVFSDEHIHTALPGETVAIPYHVAESAETVTLTTRFGLEQPLNRVLRKKDSPTLSVPVSTGQATNTSIEVGRVTYDGAKGELRIALSGQGVVDAELLVSDD